MKIYGANDQPLFPTSPSLVAPLHQLSAPQRQIFTCFLLNRGKSCNFRVSSFPNLEQKSFTISQNLVFTWSSLFQILPWSPKIVGSVTPRFCLKIVQSLLVHICLNLKQVTRLCFFKPVSSRPRPCFWHPNFPLNHFWRSFELKINSFF